VTSVRQVTQRARYVDSISSELEFLILLLLRHRKTTRLLGCSSQQPAIDALGECDCGRLGLQGFKGFGFVLNRVARFPGSEVLLWIPTHGFRRGQSNVARFAGFWGFRPRVEVRGGRREPVAARGGDGWEPRTSRNDSIGWSAARIALSGEKLPLGGQVSGQAGRPHLR
jgi:hypothetical protein